MALILHPVYELYQKNNTAFCSSLQVALEFGKLHKNVIADIRNLDCSEDFNRLNFQPVKYTDEKGEKRPMYLMTRDGFMFLVMGYRGKKAANIKEAIIKRFNDMEFFIRAMISAKEEYPAFAQAIADAHDDPQGYHFSNEFNLINRIVLGMDAKHFREAHGIPPNLSIKPFLSDQQAKDIRKLMAKDIQSLYRGLDYNARKLILEATFLNIQEGRLHA